MRADFCSVLTAKEHRILPLLRLRLHPLTLRHSFVFRFLLHRCLANYSARAGILRERRQACQDQLPT